MSQCRVILGKLLRRSSFPGIGRLDWISISAREETCQQAKSQKSWRHHSVGVCPRLKFRGKCLLSKKILHQHRIHSLNQKVLQISCQKWSFNWDETENFLTLDNLIKVPLWVFLLVHERLLQIPNVALSFIVSAEREERGWQRGWFHFPSKPLLRNICCLISLIKPVMAEQWNKMEMHSYIMKTQKVSALGSLKSCLTWWTTYAPLFLLNNFRWVTLEVHCVWVINYFCFIVPQINVLQDHWVLCSWWEISLLKSDRTLHHGFIFYFVF